MDFDWRLGILILNGLVILFNIFIYITIKFNDLKHLTKDVEELKLENKDFKIKIENKLDKIFRRLGRMEKKQIQIETKLEERTKKR